MSTEIVLVYSIDEPKSLLLTAALAAVSETRNSNSATTIGDIDAPGERLQRDWHIKLLDGPQVQLVLVFAIERQENMETAWWILAVGQRVHCAQENLGLFVVARHDDDDLWCGMFVQNVFDPPRAANIVGDKLVDAKEPWHCEQASE